VAIYAKELALNVLMGHSISHVIKNVREYYYASINVKKNVVNLVLNAQRNAFTNVVKLYALTNVARYALLV